MQRLISKPVSLYHQNCLNNGRVTDVGLACVQWLQHQAEEEKQMGCAGWRNVDHRVWLHMLHVYDVCSQISSSLLDIITPPRWHTLRCLSCGVMDGDIIILRFEFEFHSNLLSNNWNIWQFVLPQSSLTAVFTDWCFAASTPNGEVNEFTVCGIMAEKCGCAVVVSSSCHQVSVPYNECRQVGRWTIPSSQKHTRENLFLVMCRNQTCHRK